MGAYLWSSSVISSTVFSSNMDVSHLDQRETNAYWVTSTTYNIQNHIRKCWPYCFVSFFSQLDVRTTWDHGVIQRKRHIDQPRVTKWSQSAVFTSEKSVDLQPTNLILWWRTKHTPPLTPKIQWWKILHWLVCQPANPATLVQNRRTDGSPEQRFLSFLRILSVHFNLANLLPEILWQLPSCRIVLKMIYHQVQICWMDWILPNKKSLEEQNFCLFSSKPTWKADHGGERGELVAKASCNRNTQIHKWKYKY